MNVNNYKFSGPTVISFSGGRTSGRLLYECLDAGLGPDTHVIFCNTGKEHVRTLEFVNECAKRWGATIVWLEYHRTRFPKYKTHANEQRQREICACAGRMYDEPGDEEGFRKVTFETASRKGEPFENLIDLSGLPNFGAPFCSTELKTRVIKKYMQSLGYKRWTSVVGIRADESWRIAKMRANSRKDVWDVAAPMVEAGERVRDVFDFWLGHEWMPGMSWPLFLPQGFDLGLQPEWGNCIHCLKKQPEKLVRIAAHDMSTLDWWQEQEARTGSVWRPSVSLAQIRRAAERGAPPMLPGIFEDAIACACTD